MISLPALPNRLVEKYPRICLGIAIISVIGWILIAVVWKTGTISCSQECNCPPGVEISNGDTKPTHEGRIPKNFSENEWNTYRFNKSQDGFWCPRRGFNDPVMWLLEGIDLNATCFEVEYEIKKVQNNTINPPSFVLEYAQKKDPKKRAQDDTVIPIYKLWAPEGENHQLFRFSKNNNYGPGENDPEKALTKEEAVSLTSPVKSLAGSSNTLTASITNKAGDEINLNFIYKYTPMEVEKSISDTIPKTIKMPASDVNASNERFYFGIGTFSGYCIRPISYTICR